MYLHHLAGEAGIEALKLAEVWDPIEEAMEEKRALMLPNALAMISVLAPSVDQTAIILAHGWMLQDRDEIMVLLLDGLEGEQDYVDGMAIMERIRKIQNKDFAAGIFALGGMPKGMKRPLHPEWN